MPPPRRQWPRPSRAAAPSVESLEGRTLLSLSAGDLDPNFGQVTFGTAYNFKRWMVNQLFPYYHNGFTLDWFRISTCQRGC